MPANSTLTDLSDRVGALETSVSGLASSVSAFIKESEKNWKQSNVDRDRLWQELEKQGQKGDLSWGKIASVGGFVMVAISGLGALVWQLSEARVHQLELVLDGNEKQTAMRLEFQKEIRTLESEVRATHDKFLLRICDENHESIKRINEK